MQTAIEKATILSQALPYVQKYNGKIIVIKYGGNAMLDEAAKQSLIDDVVLLSEIGVKVVLVHGGGPDINDTLEKMQLTSHFVDGLRYTDDATMEVVQMVLCGKINKELVGYIDRAGARGVGISGMDAGLIRVVCTQDGKLGHVGEVTEVRSALLADLLELGYIPVVATVGMDEEGQTYNINADLAAAAIAGALEAENMVMVSNVPGVLRDCADESSLISEIRISEVSKLKEKDIISGGMIPKIDCCLAAVQAGVKKACMIDGRIPHALLIETMTDAGIGTMLTRGDKNE